MTKVKELEGHTARVLHMAAGADGTVVSAGADETLRFWNIFGAGATPRVPTKTAAPGIIGGAGIR